MSNRDPVRLSDEDLVRRFQRDPDGQDGKEAASELFERYWEQVYLWCYRRIGRHEAACDVAQDVFLSAYQALGRFEGRCLYCSWLFTIMRHRCFRVLRKASLVRDEGVEIDEIPHAGRAADDALIEREDEDAILDLIRRFLDPEEQAALWLRCFEHLPVDEITRRLGLGGASGARTVLQGARRKLRAAMDRRAGGGGENP